MENWSNHIPIEVEGKAKIQQTKQFKLRESYLVLSKQVLVVVVVVLLISPLFLLESYCIFDNNNRNLLEIKYFWLKCDITQKLPCSMNGISAELVCLFHNNTFVWFNWMNNRFHTQCEPLIFCDFLWNLFSWIALIRNNYA